MKRAIGYLAPAAAVAAMVLAPSAGAREYFVGGPVHKNDMEIVANYLIGIELKNPIRVARSFVECCLALLSVEF